MVFVNVSTTQWVTIVNFVNHCTMTFNGSQQLEKTKMNARVRCYFDHIQGGNIISLVVNSYGTIISSFLINRMQLQQPCRLLYLQRICVPGKFG